MKRQLVFAAVLAAFVGVPAISWALEMTMGGDYRLRGFYIENLTDADSDSNDSAAYYSSRFLLTAAATEDNVTGVTTLIVGQTSGNGNRLLGGDPTPGPSDPTGVYGPESSSEVGFLEAYIKADFGGWKFAGGRKVYKLGHGIVLDDAVDGLWADVKAGGIVVTLATLKLVERTNSTVVGIGNSGDIGTGGDADLYVVNAAFGNMMGGDHTDVFVTYLSDRSAEFAGGGGSVDDDATLWGIGAVYGGMVGPLHLHGEVDFFNGESNVGGTKTDLKGLNVVLGGKLDAGPVPVGLDLIYASGEDPTASGEDNVNGINGNYPIGIILTNTGARSLDTKDGTCLSVDGSSLGGSLGCVNGTGLMAVKLSSGYTHGPHVFDVALIWAQSAEDPDGAGFRDESIGIEIDATLTWALTKRLSFLAGIGYLLPGDFSKPAANVDPDELTVLVSQLSYTF